MCFRNICNPKMHCYLQFHGAPFYFTEILSYFNWVFTLLFTVECAFKLTSFGPKVSPTVFNGFSRQNLNSNLVHSDNVYIIQITTIFPLQILIWSTQAILLFFEDFFSISEWDYYIWDHKSKSNLLHDILLKWANKLHIVC